MKFKIKEVFLNEQLHGGESILTEEYLYNHSDDSENLIPVHTASVVFQDKFVNKHSVSKVFKGGKNTIKFTRNGDVGFAKTITDKDFTINDHAYIGYLSNKILQKYELKTSHVLGFVAYNVEEFSSSINGNGTFNKSLFLETEFDTDLLSEYLTHYKNKALNYIFSRINQLQSSIRQTEISYEYIDSKKVSELFDVHTGLGSLTEEFIYNNSSTINQVPVYTGALNFEGKYVDRESISKDKIYKGPCIRLLKDGVNSGQARIMSNNDFTINSHALVLKPKAKLNLPFYSFYLRQHVLKLRNDTDGNPTLNKEIFENSIIEIPSLKQQIEISKLIKIVNDIDSINNFI